MITFSNAEHRCSVNNYSDLFRLFAASASDYCALLLFSNIMPHDRDKCYTQPRSQHASQSEPIDNHHKVRRKCRN